MKNKSNKRRYMDGCFCANWVDVEVNSEQPKAHSERTRKDLQILLEELEEIKRNYKKIDEKRQFLEELMRFHRTESAES